MVEGWINGLVLSGMKLNFILRNELIPIFDPILQYSNIPTFEQTAGALSEDNITHTCLIPACSG